MASAGVQGGKFLQEYPVNTGIRQGSILCSTHFLLYINDLPVMMLSVLLQSMLMILLSTVNLLRHPVCGNR